MIPLGQWILPVRISSGAWACTSTSTGVSYTGSTTSRSKDSIYIIIQNDPLANISIDDATKFLAHEFVHVYGNFLSTNNGDSQFEENLGDLYSKYICTPLGISNNDNIASPWDENALNTKYENTSYSNFPVFSCTFFIIYIWLICGKP
jgi:hypothetical protein